MLQHHLLRPLFAFCLKTLVAASGGTMLLAKFWRFSARPQRQGFLLQPTEFQSAVRPIRQNPLLLRATGFNRCSKVPFAQLPDTPGPLGHKHDLHGNHQGLGFHVAILCSVAACRKGFRIGGLFALTCNILVRTPCRCGWLQITFVRFWRKMYRIPCR